MNMRILALGIAASATITSSVNAASIAITEYMYGGDGKEFIEITNVSNAPISLSGWSFDDDSQVAGTVSLSSLGTLASGESAIIAEAAAATFRASWGLSASVKVLGSNGVNLGRADAINIFDGATLVDQLVYGDNAAGGGPRTQDVSANIPLAKLGLQGLTLADNYASAKLVAASVVGDAYQSISATGGLGNPGSYAPFTPVPEPTSIALAGIGALAMLRRRRAR